MNVRVKSTAILLACALAVPLAAFWAEWRFGLPESDGSIFRYIGKLVAEGGTMYVDAWDCKGPVLLGAAALGQVLFPMTGNAGAVLLFALAAVLAIGLFGRLAQSGLATLAFACLYIGNYAGRGLVSQETLAIPFALLAMCLVLSARGRTSAFGCAFGACVALVVFIKANLAGFALAGLMAAIEAADDVRAVCRWIASAALGFILTVGAFVGIFAWQGALAEMIDGTFLFGLLEYGRHDCSLVGWWLDYFARWHPSSGGWILAHFAVLTALAVCAWRSCPHWLKVWLVVDLASIFAFKTFYEHYLIVCYPELCLMLLRVRSAGCAKVVHVFLAGSIAVFAAYSVYGTVLTARKDAAIAAAAERVRGQTVAAWGDLLTAEVLVRANARCPQRYFNAHMNAAFAGDRRRAKIVLELEQILGGGVADMLMLDAVHVDDFRARSSVFGSVAENWSAENIGRLVLFKRPGVRLQQSSGVK